jgi:CheY-like chemotaxis protein
VLLGNSKEGRQGMSRDTTIVLVEDERDDADLIAYAFEKTGIPNPLLTLRDGDAAAEFVEQIGSSAQAPELFLLDLKLPRRSGFDVLSLIRKEAETKLVPVVVLTSSDHDADIERAYALGANSYLIKPPTRDALLTMVKMVDAYWLKLNRAAIA